MLWRATTALGLPTSVLRLPPAGLTAAPIARLAAAPIVGPSAGRAAGRAGRGAGAGRAVPGAAGDEGVAVRGIAARGGVTRCGAGRPGVTGLAASGGIAWSAGSGQRGLPGAGRRKAGVDRSPGTISRYAPPVPKIT
ncbi:hypothetical protein [Actinomadura sp. 9N215]|uniref:hypothetical protein n=1 Tax=Actinomadura sp. 9N215 TaxID=3375150 RepID=UPI0037A028D9